MLWNDFDSEKKKSTLKELYTLEFNSLHNTDFGAKGPEFQF
jgi:hypothetical protein